jgi:hypothetical protein
MDFRQTQGIEQRDEIGDQQVLIDVTTGGSFVENEYAEGFLVVNKATGIGEIHKILANKIRSSDILMDVLLETPLRLAWDATTEVTLLKLFLVLGQRSDQLLKFLTLLDKFTCVYDRLLDCRQFSLTCRAS